MNAYSTLSADIVDKRGILVQDAVESGERFSARIV